MNIADCLDDLRSRLPDCHVVGFGDVEACLVLKAAHDQTVPREVLDGYCTEAVSWFATAQDLACNAGSQDRCTILTTRDLRVYLRAQGRSDFLFLICSLDSDMDQVMSEGTTLLHRLAAAE